MYNIKAINAKITFGVQAATNGDILPLTAKVLDTVMKSIYPKLSAKPSAILYPIPPFIFLADSAAPIIVRR